MSLFGLRDWINNRMKKKDATQFLVNFQKYLGLKEDGTSSQPLFHYTLLTASALAIEVFNIVPAIYWMALPVGPNLICCFFTFMVFGQYFKDVLELPRPPFDSKVVKLEHAYETEHGFPSTHTICGVLPLTILMNLTRKGFAIECRVWLLCGFWFVLVALSRLYVGVHWGTDVIGGIVISAFCCLLMHFYGDQFDSFVHSDPMGVYVPVCATVAFVLLYPRTSPWSASYGTAATIVGTWVGCSTAIWASTLGYVDTLIELQASTEAAWTAFSIYFSSDTDVAAAAAAAATAAGTTGKQILWDCGLRTAAGLLLVLLVNVAFKYGTRFAMYLLDNTLGISSILERKGERVDPFNKPVPFKRLYWVEIPSKLVSYSAVGWATVVGAPLVWRALGIAAVQV